MQLASDAIPEDTLLHNRLERLGALQAYVESPDYYALQQARLMVLAGERCEQEGDITCALEKYRDALQLNSRLIPAYYELYRLYNLLGEHDQAQAILSQVESLSPTFPLATPASLDNSVLFGYDLDEALLEMDRNVEVTLYLQTGGSPSTDFTKTIEADWQIYRLGDRLYQVGSVINMATNGGFELTSTINDQQPSGFTAERYGPDKYAAHRIVINNERGMPTICAELDNSRVAGGPSGYMSSDFWPVTKNTPYLLGGWVHSVQQAGKIGLLWMGGEVPDNQRNSYVSPSSDRGGWVYHAGVLEPPNNAVFLRLQLLNQISDGLACFDNVFLVPIQPVQTH
jgi:hypothetical protein